MIEKGEKNNGGIRAGNYSKHKKGGGELERKNKSGKAKSTKCKKKRKESR